MKKTTVLFSMMLLAGFVCLPNSLRASGKLEKHLAIAPATASPAPIPAAPQAKTPQWKNRAEYDAFQAFVNEKDPQKRITLIQAFIEKYPKSDFLANAYLAEMQTYVQMQKTSDAVASAKKALGVDADNLPALYYVSFTFPYTFKPSDPNASAELSQAQQYAQHGLQLLQSEQKRPGESQEQFDARAKQEREAFNVAIGFAAVQQKDFNQAIKSLEAAAQDQPDNVLIYSLLSQAYYNENPRDVNKAIWNLARAADLAESKNGQNAEQLKKSFGQVYEAQHGSNEGEDKVLEAAKNSPNMPAGFSVAAPPHHAATGDTNLDGFYKIQDALAVGGDTAQQNWEQLKGQPLGLVGHVDSVDAGTDPKTTLVRVDISPDSQGKPGTYDIVLKDSQPYVKELQAGDPIRFQGNIEAYSAAPNFYLTLNDVKIDDSVLKSAHEKALAEAQKRKK